VLSARGKFGSKIFSHYTDIVIFVLGYFNLAHPVYYCCAFNKLFSVSVNSESQFTILSDEGGVHSESIVRVQTPASDAASAAAAAADDDDDDEYDDVVGDVILCWVRDASSLHR